MKTRLCCNLLVLALSPTHTLRVSLSTLSSTCRLVTGNEEILAPGDWCLNVVYICQNYPGEGISKIMQNVFDFDQYDQASKELLIEIFEKHGIPIGLESDFSMNLGDIIELGEPILSERWSRVQQSKRLQASIEASEMAIRVSYHPIYYVTFAYARQTTGRMGFGSRQKDPCTRSQGKPIHRVLGATLQL